MRQQAKRQWRFKVLGVEVKPTKEKLMKIKFNTNQEVLLRLGPVDENQEPILLDPDAVVIQSTNVNGSSITAQVVEGTNDDEDPTVDILIRPGSGTGVAFFIIKVDAEPGDGFSFIEEMIEVVVTPAGAGAVDLNLETVEIRKRTDK